MTVDAVLPTFPPRPTDPTEPAPLFARLRRARPVALVALPTGDRAWLVTRYHDNRRVLGDAVFSRAAAAAGAARARPIPLEQRSITTLDPPEHTAVRRAALPWFTRAAAQRLRPRVERTAARLLDRLIGQGEPADLVTGFAQPLALTVIGDLLGLPAADRDRFRAWTDAYLGTSTDNAADVERARVALDGHLRELVARRRRVAVDGDLLSGLAASGLGEAEVVALAGTLVVAGYQTVANEIAASVVVLLRQPEQHRLLLAGRVSLDTAVDELLRYTPLAASGGTIRVALRDVRLGGVLIRAGEAVLPSTTSANRDGTIFLDADRLDLSRRPNPHVAFGHGVHRCLGAHLARLELRVALDALTARLPRLRSAVPLDGLGWDLDKMIRGPRALPIAWTGVGGRRDRPR
jgi:nocardicin N-oxygenase